MGEWRANGLGVARRGIDEKLTAGPPEAGGANSLKNSLKNPLEQLAQTTR